MSLHYLPAHVMARLHERFRRLYGEEADRCLRRLEMLVGRYGVGVGVEREWPPLDERSTVLITWPDTIRSPSMRPLVALRHFVEQRLAGAFGAIHILPFLPSSSGRGRAVVDYREVNPELGTWSHVERLGRSFELVFDLVLGHVSSRSDWFKEYVSGIAPASRYFHEVDPGTDLSAVARPHGGSLLRHTHTSRGERDVWATFGEDRIDLNFANPDVLFEFLDILLLYVSKGVRVVRLDAVAHLWKAAGTPCVHLEETHEIVRLLRDVLELVAPGVLVLAGTSGPREENVHYFGAGDEADLVCQYDLPPLILHALHAKRADHLREWAGSLDEPPSGRSFLNFTASHESIGLRPLEDLLPRREIELLVEKVASGPGPGGAGPPAGGSTDPLELDCTYFDALADRRERGTPLHVARFLCSQTLMLSLRGVPAVYIHSLLAASGGARPEHRKVPARSLDPAAWEEGELNALLDESDSITSRVFRETVRRVEARRQHPSFHPEGPQEVLDLGPALFGIRRTAPDGREAILAVGNVTDSPQELEVTPERLGRDPAGVVYDLLQSGGVPVRGGRVQLEPYGCCWLRAEG